MVTVGFSPMANLRGEKGEEGPIGPVGPEGERGPEGLPGVNAVANDTATAAQLASLTSETRAALIAALGEEAFATRLAPGYVQGEVPAGLGWGAGVALSPSLTVDASGRITGSAGVTPEGLFDSRSWARANPTVTYYVSGTGVDTNDGLTLGTAFRTIRRAIQAINTAAPAQGGRVYIDGSNRNAFGFGQGWYTGTEPTATRPVYDIALIGINGTPEIGPFVDLTGAAVDGTFPNTTSVAFSGAQIPVRCIDMWQSDAQGVHADMEWRATPAEVNAEPGTWTLNAGKLYFQRRDGFRATTENTRVFLDVVNVFLQTENDAYLENLKLWGGRGSGALTITNQTVPESGNRYVVAKNCEFSYGGGTSASGSVQTLATNGVGVNSFRGYTMFFGCKAHGNWKDGFNWHNATAPYHFALTVNCEAYDNGRAAETSCNGWTIHENVIGVDIAGRYSRSHGGTIHNIGTSKMYALGTVSTDDSGDIDRGGVLDASQFRSGDAAELWLDHVQVAGSGIGFITGGAGAIRLRDVPLSPLSRVGNITTY